DWDRLEEFPAESLGRAYLALARRDQIRVGDLVAGAHGLPDERERAPDPLRRWYRDRMTAMHDLLHVLTGYGRDRPGELLLIAFTLAIAPMRVLRIAIVLGPFAIPPRALPGMLRDLWRAWRRGAASQISRATRWETLLPLPIAEVQARLGVAPERAAHPRGIWRERDRVGVGQGARLLARATEHEHAVVGADRHEQHEQEERRLPVDAAPRAERGEQLETAERREVRGEDERGDAQRRDHSAQERH